MNAGARKAKLPLPCCPVCGMDSGERMQAETEPFLYYVRCTSCGAVTKGYGAPKGATVAWKNGKVSKMKYRTYPVCAKCSIVMDPIRYDDVTPGFSIDGETYCPECFKNYMRDELDSDPVCVAHAMGVPVLELGGS